jgi:hypothetical protein
MKSARRTLSRTRRIAFSLYLPGFYHFSTSIKAKNPKPVLKPRQTLAKQIRTAAYQDLGKAYLLAMRGRQFSEIEDLLHSHYAIYRHRQLIATGSRSRLIELAENVLNYKLTQKQKLEVFDAYIPRDFERLNKIFFNAIKNRDSKKIIEIANAVEFLKSFHVGKNCDRHRAKILFLKEALDGRGERWTIRKLAEIIKWPKVNTIDGMAQLRRLCHELKFPLAPSRQISGK